MDNNVSFDIHPLHFVIFYYILNQISTLQIMFKQFENQDVIEENLIDGTIKRYVKGRLLGKGGFAKCYQFTSLQTEKKYAAKIIEKATLEKSKARDKLTSEIKIHKSLNYHHIVHFEHFFQDANYVYILLQKCPNQTLNQLLKRRKRLTDVEAKYYIFQLAQAISYLHSQKVIHRDLKLSNLFLSEKLQIKIGDFGLATKLAHDGERKKTKCGTPNYIAPEILDQKKSHSYEVDVWSMGVIAYTLLIGKPPFETNDVKMTYNRIKSCDYSFPDSINICPTAKAFIRRMLQLDPSKRPTSKEILSDPFLTSSKMPNYLPISSLACPPSGDFLNNYKTIIGSGLSQNQTSTVKEFFSVKNNEQLCLNKKKQKGSQSKAEFSKKNSLSKCQFKETPKTFTSSMSKVFSQTNFNTKNSGIDEKIGKKKKHSEELMKQAMSICVTYFEENQKFGMGYLLNSNCAGFRFNDSTVMIKNSKNTSILYLQYDSKNKKLKEGKIFTNQDCEKVQYKKFKILSHFQKQLKSKKNEIQEKMSNERKINLQYLQLRQIQDNEMSVFVTKFYTTNKGTVFWFNNKSIQIIFEDSSQLHLSCAKVFTYVNKYGDRTYFLEKDKDEQREEIKKRLLHFQSLFKGKLQKKEENNENKAPLSRCSSSKNVSLKGVQETKGRMKMQLKSSSSGRLELKRSIGNKILK